MKRKILGLTAVVLALSLSSFVERPKSEKFGQYYWFPLDTTGSPVIVQHLVYQSGDPYLCAQWAWGDYCSAAYLSYTNYPGGGYAAAGFLIVVDYHILPL